MASWLQSAPTIARIYPIAAQTDERGLVCITPTLDALDRALHSLHYRGVRHAIQDIQLEEMWTAPVRKRLQHAIIKELQDLVKATVVQSIFPPE